MGETGSITRGGKEEESGTREWFCVLGLGKPRPKTQNHSLVQDSSSFHPLVMEPLYLPHKWDGQMPYFGHPLCKFRLRLWPSYWYCLTVLATWTSLHWAGADPHQFASMHVHRSILEVHRFISKCIGQFLKSTLTIFWFFGEAVVAILLWEVRFLRNDVCLCRALIYLVNIGSFEICISIKDDALFLIINYECLGYHWKVKYLLLKWLPQACSHS